MTPHSLASGLAAACLIVAMVVPVAAQSTGCPIATDSTVSQAIGSPMSGKLDATVGELTLCSFSGAAESGLEFGVYREKDVFGPGEGGAAALAIRYVPQLPDAARAQIDALQQIGVSVAVPDYQLEAVGGVGDSAVWVRSQLLPGWFRDSLLVQRGGDAFAFDADESPDAQSALTTLARAVLANLG